MLLPQSSAFGALKNRLNSVSAIGLLHTPASMPTAARPSVAAGMSGQTLPSAPGTTVSGRLNRTRDANAASDVKWPELLDKFKQTQEKARRRNERLLRGGIDADNTFGPTSATRSLADAIDGGGRESRTSNRSGGEGGVRSGAGRTGVLGRPLSLAGPPGGTAAAGARGGPAGLGLPGSTGAVGGIPGTVGADGRTVPHKRGHSLAGGFGKFASGIARAGGSRDRDKDKDKDKGKR